VETGLVDAATLEEVLLAQRTDRRRLGEILVERGIVHAHQLAQVLSHQLACPWVSLTNLVLAPSLLALVPREIALRWNVVPVYLRTAKATSSLYVAVDDPTDETALVAIAEAAGMTVKPMVAAASEIHAALVAYYGAEPKPKLLALTLPAPKPPKPATPPPPPPPVVTIVPEPLLEEADVISEAHAPVASARLPIVLVVQAPDAFTHVCRDAALAVGARVETADLMMASGLASAHGPFAIVVTDDIYAFDRHGLNGLALESDAVLVVWSDDLEARQLQPLLKIALTRRRA
jgi:type IV pilus assembly protein PilB